MQDSDIILGYYKNSQEYILDYKAYSSSTPTLDEIQNIEAVSVTEEGIEFVVFNLVGGITTIEFDRLLNTGDASQDIVINPQEETFILWGFHSLDPESPTSFLQHSARGVASIKFQPDIVQSRRAIYAPSKPAPVSLVNSTSKSLFLRWTAPSDNGGSPIVGYTLMVR